MLLEFGIWELGLRTSRLPLLLTSTNTWQTWRRQGALNEPILRGEKAEEILGPLIAAATAAVEKYTTASKHIKKFLVAS